MNDRALPLDDDPLGVSVLENFALDGTTFTTVTKAQVEAAGTWVFDQPFYLLLNVAVGGRWPGPPSAGTAWPQQLVVDYVRVYADS